MASALLFLGACATGPLEVDPSTFAPEPLEQASQMPTPEEVKREKPRVAILPLELRRGRDPVSEQEAGSLEPALRSELEAALLASDKVELLDRNLALRLQGALAAYERNKGETPKPFQQADYLIISQIDLAASDSEYRQPTTNSKGRVVPGVCISEGEISGVLKVYDLLENTTVGIEEIGGRERDVDEAAGCRPLSAAETRQLYQKATKKAVGSASDFIRAFFAPRGFVAEKRTDGKGWAFKVSTRGEAMSEYKTVKIYDRRRAENALTGELETEALSLGTATVTDQSGDDFVWIYVKDRALADRVRLGHLVKPDATAFDAFKMLRKLKL